MTRILADLLDEASAHVTPVDLAERAWSGARARRRSVARRSLITVAAAAAVVAIVPALLDGKGDPGPTATPGATTAALTPTTGRADPIGQRVGTGTVWRLPEESLVPTLPWLDLGLPSRIALPTRLVALADDPISTVRAVLMTDAAGGGYHPVLMDPRGEYRIVADVTVQPTVDSGGNTHFAIGPGTVSPDRTKVVLPSQGAIVLIDLAAGTRVRVPVPDPYVEWAGWSLDGSAVIVRSADRAWTVAAGGRSVRELPPPAGAGHYGLVAYSGKLPDLATFDASGRLQARAPAPPGVVSGWQLTASSLTGWAATGVFLSAAASDELDGAYQGVLAVNADTPSSWRMVVPPAGASSTWSKGCCSVQGWSGQRLVVVEVHAGSSSWLLAWDMVSGQVYRVSELGPTIAVDGTDLVGPLAIGPLPDPR